MKGGECMEWIIVLGCVLVVLLAIGYAIFVRCFVRWPQPHEQLELPHTGAYERCWDTLVELIDAMEKVPYQEVCIRAHDGVELRARYYHFQDGAPVQIQMHGYRGSYRDFCGGFALARAMGYNILLVHQRAHGKSGGRVITFGIRERLDCVAWARYVAQKAPDVPIILCGVSMGATTVLMASALDLPPTVKGVIADCPYTTPEAIIRKVCQVDLRLPAALAMPLVRLSALLYGGFRLSDASACEALAATSLPVLLIHGEEDGFVPCRMSRELAACGKDVTLLIVPEADHGISYMVDSSAYTEAVKEFTERIRQ